MTKDRFAGPARSPFNLSSVMKWKNTSGESIPAYACVKLDSYDAAGDFFNAIKPDGSGDLHFVNGPVAVAVNKYGGSQLWNQSRIGLTSSVTFGAVVGPVADSWEMEESGSGFVVFSEPSGGEAAILQVGGGSGGGTHEIWFTIISVECPSPTETILTVLPTYYTGCSGDIPGADPYTCYCIVEDVCSILSYYTKEDLVGRVGRATYMYPYSCGVAADCNAGLWLVDTICGSPECA